MPDFRLDRRSFLGATAVAGLSLGLNARFAFGDEPSGKPSAGKIGDFKISLAEWSLHKALFAKDGDDHQPRLPPDRPRGLRDRRPSSSSTSSSRTRRTTRRLPEGL